MGRDRADRPRVPLGHSVGLLVGRGRPEEHVHVRLRAHGVFGFVYFAMLDTMNPTIIFIAITISLVPVMTLYGPEAALIAESFSPRLRYSGASLGYQLASIIAGGPSPFIATALFASYHSSLPIALYMLGCAVIGLIATALMTDLHRQGDFGRIRKGLNGMWAAGGRRRPLAGSCAFVFRLERCSRVPNR